MVLGLIGPEWLPDIAGKAMEEGADSESLRLLAGFPKPYTDEVTLIFKKALVEIGMSQPSRRDAVLILVSEIAQQIVAGEILPYQGAKKISELHSLIADDDNSIKELHPFVYAVDEWEDRPDERSFFDKAIINEAKEIIYRIK